MKWARFRLIAAGTLFVAWLGWLGYLAASKTNPVVVSRSQVMASTHFVLAEVTVEPDTGHPSKQVKVVEDLRPSGPALDGFIDVRNIREARVAGGADGFKGPGPYLFMLTRVPESDASFLLTPAPRAPGHENAPRLQPWAYVWSAPGVQEQFEALVPRRPPG
jgi:hypothetical protein